jgi:hypothetical protein
MQTRRIAATMPGTLEDISPFTPSRPPSSSRW